MTTPTTNTQPATKVVVYRVQVEFGDCDPARIVWFPNFFRWIDAASRHFFVQCGVPSWHETEATLGVIGTPLVDTHATFVKTASYGDSLDIHTTVSEWREKSFVLTYQIRRGSDEIMRCEEVRIFAAHRDASKTSIRALPIPPSIQALCQA